MPETTISPTTHTFTGDRQALHQWLSQRSHFRIADITFADKSVLLYGDARPLAVQGWCSAAVGQTLDDTTFPASYTEVECAAAGLAGLLERGEMVGALLADAETCKELGDPKARAQRLKEALGVSREQQDAVRTFASHVAYDTRTGTVFELPDRETLLARVPVRGAGLEPVREAVAGAAGQTMTGTAFADLLVEAARTTLPDVDGSDEVWRERGEMGRELYREVLPEVVSRVLVDVPEGAVNEALRHVGRTRRLE
ncbi:hypothetical protein ACGFZS_46910 [Streptomyces sp. NPDC048288]|uniref:hypothetical protein n=1 Tax=Streptomyces sp. NPDC048288 TaxID=3365529 RepID=UPI0037153781